MTKNVSIKNVSIGPKGGRVKSIETMSQNMQFFFWRLPQPRMSSCPECRDREVYQERRRHRWAEREAEELKKMREELSKMT